MNKKNQSTLWKINFEDGPDSYLFGSMHVMDQRAFARVETVVGYLKKCQKFYTEIDLEQSGEIDSKHFNISANLGLQDLMSTKQYLKLSDTLKKYFDFNIDLYQNLLPIITINKLAEHILQGEYNASLDAFLWSKASELELQTGGLESLSSQLSTLSKIDIDFQLKNLLDLSKNPLKFRKQTLNLIQFYLEERIDLIYQQTRKSLGKFRREMLFDRNINMSNFIISNKDVASFYVIGAAHLAGNEGVLALLKKAKFRVNAIN